MQSERLPKALATALKKADNLIQLIMDGISIINNGGIGSILSALLLTKGDTSKLQLIDLGNNYPHEFSSELEAIIDRLYAKYLDLRIKRNLSPAILAKTLC